MILSVFPAACARPGKRNAGPAVAARAPTPVSFANRRRVSLRLRGSLMVSSGERPARGSAPRLHRSNSQKWRMSTSFVSLMKRLPITKLITATMIGYQRPA